MKKSNKSNSQREESCFSKIQNIVPFLEEELILLSSIAKPLGYSNISFLSRGKRGYVFLANYNKKKVCIKSKNPQSTVDTLLNEYNFLKRLKNHNLSPKPLENHNTFISMEFIEGLPFEEFLKNSNEKNSKTKIILIIWQLIDQMLLLDLLGINKQEMTHPTKHIIITQKKLGKNKKLYPVLIDFERARFSKNPRNLTQFISYLNSNKISTLLNQKDILINSQNILDQIKDYKKTIRNTNSLFNTQSVPSIYEDIIIKIKKNIWLNPSNFSEKVLTQTLLIPKGKVVSYAYIAKKLNTKAFRAIGVALSKNQFAPIVPCHRVVCSNGFIGGFNGSYKNMKIKEKLLKSEGIETFKLKDKNFIPEKYFF